MCLSSSQADPAYWSFDFIIIIIFVKSDKELATILKEQKKKENVTSSVAL